MLSTATPQPTHIFIPGPADERILRLRQMRRWNRTALYSTLLICSAHWAQEAAELARAHNLSDMLWVHDGVKFNNC